MARGMQVARKSTLPPRTQAIAVKAAETFKAYALVTLDPALTGKIQECTAPVPTNKILGLALQGAGTGPGFDVSESTVNTTLGVVAPDGQAATNGVASVVIADQDQEFSARGVNGGTDPFIPDATLIGKQFGVKKVGNDWVIDIANVTDVVLQVTDVRPDLSMNLILFKFLESVLIGQPQ